METIVLYTVQYCTVYQIMCIQHYRTVLHIASYSFLISAVGAATARRSCRPVPMTVTVRCTPEQDDRYGVPTRIAFSFRYSRPPSAADRLGLTGDGLPNNIEEINPLIARKGLHCAVFSPLAIHRPCMPGWLTGQTVSVSVCRRVQDCAGTRQCTSVHLAASPAAGPV